MSTSSGQAKRSGQTSKIRRIDPLDTWWAVMVPETTDSIPASTFALAVRDGIVVDAAPIARRWALGKSEERVATYLRRQGAQFVRLAPGATSAGE